MPSGSTSTCRGCGQTIKWIKSRNGKNTPLDPEPVRYRSTDRDDEHDVEGFLLDGERVYGVRDDTSETQLYVCHFETCPQASGFRRRGGSTAQRDRGQSRSPRGGRSSPDGVVEAPCPHCGAVIYLARNILKQREHQEDIPF